MGQTWLGVLRHRAGVLCAATAMVVLGMRAWADTQVLAPADGTRFIPFFDMEATSPGGTKLALHLTHSPLSLPAGGSTALKQVLVDGLTFTGSGPTFVPTPGADQEMMVNQIERFEIVHGPMGGPLVGTSYAGLLAVISRPSGVRQGAVQFYDDGGKALGDLLTLNVGAAAGDYSESSVALMRRASNVFSAYVGAEQVTPGNPSGIFRVDFVDGVRVGEERVSNTYMFQLTARGERLVGQRAGTIYSLMAFNDGAVGEVQQFKGVDNQFINQFDVSGAGPDGRFLMAYQFVNGPNFAGGTGIVPVNADGTFGTSTAPLTGYQPTGFVAVPGLVDTDAAGIGPRMVISDVGNFQLAQFIGNGGESLSVPVDISLSFSGIVNPLVTPADGKLLPKGVAFERLNPKVGFAWINDSPGPGEVIAGQRLDLLRSALGGANGFSGGNQVLIDATVEELSGFSLKYLNTLGMPGQSVVSLGLGGIANVAVVDDPLRGAGDTANQVLQVTPNGSNVLFHSKKHLFRATFEPVLTKDGPIVPMTQPTAQPVKGRFQFNIAAGAFDPTDHLRLEVKFDFGDDDVSIFGYSRPLSGVLENADEWKKMTWLFDLPVLGDAFYGKFTDSTTVELLVFLNPGVTSLDPLAEAALAPGTFYLDSVTFGLVMQVPEPSTALLLIPAAGAMLRRRPPRRN